MALGLRSRAAIVRYGASRGWLDNMDEIDVGQTFGSVRVTLELRAILLDVDAALTTDWLARSFAPCRERFSSGGMPGLNCWPVLSAFTAIARKISA
jgi:hypothetical protein